LKCSFSLIFDLAAAPISVREMQLLASLAGQ
jgi:hypothetical protein